MDRNYYGPYPERITFDPPGPGKNTEATWPTREEKSMYEGFLILLSQNKFEDDFYNVKLIFKNPNARQNMVTFLEQYKEDYSIWFDNNAKHVDETIKQYIAKVALDLRKLLIHHMPGSEQNSDDPERPPGPEANLGWVALEHRLDKIYRALH